MHPNIHLPYILESNPHPFYSFRGLKIQMRITIACGLYSWSRAGFWKNDGARVRAIRTIQYNNLLFNRFAVITHNWIVMRAQTRLRKIHFTVPVRLISPRRSVGFWRIGNIRYYSISRPVGKGRLKERCGLESQTNFFPFKKSPKTECGLDSRIYGMSTHTHRRARTHTQSPTIFNIEWISIRIFATRCSLYDGALCHKLSYTARLIQIKTHTNRQ